MSAKPRIHFISLEKAWTDKMTALFVGESNVMITHGNIKDFPTDNRVFVSPANCLGFMDGGIDWVLSREMFPGLQTTVQDRIKTLDIKTGLGRNYLPIGSAILVPTCKPHASCISAPTMFLPHNVSGTKNAYWSFLAALALHSKQSGSSILVATSHCCGYGGMDCHESARQMYAAYCDFMTGKTPIDATADLRDVVRFPSQDESQPDNYDNREIKEIDVKEVILKR